MRRLVAFLLFFNGLVFAESQPLVPLIENIPGRRTVNLDGPWHVIVDPYETGLRGRFYENATTETPGGGPIEYDFEASETLNVPGDWNTQKEKLFFYEGPVWYKRIVFLSEAGAHAGLCLFRRRQLFRARLSQRRSLGRT